MTSDGRHPDGDADDHPDTPPPLPAAVLWDMDGTLVDTEPYWFAAERDLVDEFGHGHWPQEHAEAVVGFDLLDSARYLQQHGGVELDEYEIVDRLLDGVIARLHRRIPWRPGARELLAEVRDAGVPSALVTMSWRRFVDPVTAALPAGTFVATITGDEVPEGEGKPSPTPYLLGAEACGADPRDCVAIEDSQTGVTSARRAGCRVLAVPNVVTPAPAPGVSFAESLSGVRLADLAALPGPDDVGGGPRPQGFSGLEQRTLAAIVAAVLLLIAGGWWFTRGDPEPALPPGAIAVDTWVPYWTLNAVIDDGVDRLDRSREVSPFWFGSRSATEIVVDENASTSLTAEFLGAVDDVHIVPSIRDEMPAGGMAGVLADPETRSLHVDTLIEFAREQDVSGLDLDYEQFAFADGRDTWEATRPDWVAFVTELADGLHADGRTLTVSVPGVWSRTGVNAGGYWVYDHGAIAEHVDRIRIMAYDFSVVEPGAIAPLSWVTDVVETLSVEVSEEYHHKLVLGVPAYGVNWVRSAVGVCPDSAEGRTGITARNALDLAERRGGVPTYDPVTAEWSFTYALTVDDGTTSCIQNRFVQWVDADGVAERTLIAREAGWGGAALWALGYDDPDVWNALVDAATRDLSVTTVP